MAFRRSLIGTLIIISSLQAAVGPAFAAEALARITFINCYKDGKFHEAQILGEKFVRANPADLEAHYFLGNTYVQLHKNEDAMTQYRSCLIKTAPDQLKGFANLALERLLKQKEGQLLAAGAVVDDEKHRQDKEIRDFERKINQESQQEQARLRSEWNMALRNLDRNYPGGGGGGFGGFGGGGFHGFDSRDHGWQSRRAYENERGRINDSFSKRMNDILEHKDSLLSQANCGTGKIRIAPALSNSKVKNYVNYGDGSEAADIPVDNPLRAQAKLLSDYKAPAANSAIVKSAIVKSTFVKSATSKNTTAKTNKNATKLKPSTL